MHQTKGANMGTQRNKKATAAQNNFYLFGLPAITNSQADTKNEKEDGYNVFWSGSRSRETEIRKKILPTHDYTEA